MTQQNVKYIESVKAYESLMPKLGYEMASESTTGLIFRAYEDVTGHPIARTEAILEFGCGGGDTTVYLNEKGYDVQGVDILEYWGKDAALYGAAAPVVPERFRPKLHVVDPNENKLPFADNTFALIFSDQTLEHVFDYRSIFLEQARVLKPGGIAIHRFPHAFTRIEPHTRVPVTFLNRYKAYLAIWALLGRRNSRQVGMDWRSTVESNARVYSTTNYVPKRTLLEAASGLGLEAHFEDFLDIATGRAARLYRAAKAIGLGAIARPVLGALQDNRVLVLRKPAR